MATTHGFPLYDSSFAPDVPNHLNAISNAAEAAVPIRSASAPAHLDGRLWFDENTEQLKVSNGTSWANAGMSVSVTGTPAVGSFDASRPRDRHYHFLSGTSDSNGLFTFAPPAATTCVLFANGSAAAGWVRWRYDLTTTSSVVMQLRDFTTGAAMASTAYVAYCVADVVL